MDASFHIVQKASQNFSRKRKTKFKKFSAAACTWTKTPIRLQVWNLFANSEQILRAADCNKLAENPMEFSAKRKGRIQVDASFLHYFVSSSCISAILLRILACISFFLPSRRAFASSFSC